MISEWVADLMCCVSFVSGGLLTYLLAWAEFRSLVCGAEREDRTPQKIGSRFYYIVPESDYCRLTTALIRYRQQYGELCQEHEWIGHKNYVPGEPDDYVEYCKHCGMENPGSR